MTDDVRLAQERLLARIDTVTHASGGVRPATRLAFLDVPRHLFAGRYRSDRDGWRDVDTAHPGAALRDLYSDHAVLLHVDDATGALCTLSQPSLVLRMIDLLELEPGQRVFELGAGSGWNAALMGRLVGPRGRVDSVEILTPMVERARASLRIASSFGDLSNVHIHAGDASWGVPSPPGGPQAPHEPYDRAVFTAGAFDLPSVFYGLVRDHGLLLAVFRWVDARSDRLFLLERQGDGFTSRASMTVSFVPVTGAYGKSDREVSDAARTKEFEPLAPGEAVTSLRVVPAKLNETPRPGETLQRRGDSDFFFRTGPSSG